MKHLLPAAALIAGLFILTINTSCKKTDVSSLTPKEDLVPGHWLINRIQLRLYSGGVFIKDTIIKQTPMPSNFVNFGANGSFEYRFNTPVSDIGQYVLSGNDSLIANVGYKTYQWKMLTITKDVFTVVNTTISDAWYPSGTVETYQTFSREK